MEVSRAHGSHSAALCMVLGSGSQALAKVSLSPFPNRAWLVLVGMEARNVSHSPAGCLALGRKREHQACPGWAKKRCTYGKPRAR